MDDSRIIELEIKAAYQEDLLQALNQTAAKQQQAIQRLEATCLLLHEKIKSLTERGRGKPEDETVQDIPPHY